MPARPRAVAFDIIGTVFTMEPMRAQLISLGLPPLALDHLYGAGLRDAFALAAAGRYAPFMETLAGSLDELLALHGIAADRASRDGILATMRTLPPHPDAGAAFETLRAADLPVVALSNGAAAATRGLLEAAGLDGLVARILSVEEVSLSKPRPEVYRYAAAAMGVAPGELALVAAHPWDVQGAMAAGLLGAYVSRGQPFSPALGRPDLAGENLLDVAGRIAAL